MNTASLLRSTTAAKAVRTGFPSSLPSFASLTTRSAVSLAYNHFGSHENRSHHPVVIGHGLFGHKANWNSVAKQMQRQLDNQVFAIDFRNHGDSPHVDSMTYPEMVEDLEKFVRDVVLPDSGFDSVHLLGHSMGGKASTLFATLPGPAQLLKSVIIEDISPVSESRNIHFRRYISHMMNADLTKSRKEISEDLSHVITDLPTRQFLLTNLAPSEDNKTRLRWKPNLQVLHDHIEHVLRFTVDNGTFSKPSLFIYGANSNYLNEKDFTVIKEMFPAVQFVSIPKAGHWVHAENPGDFLDAVIRFIKSC